MSFERVYPELARAEHGQVLYGCSICLALSFRSFQEALDHVNRENKGKRWDSQWRHEPVLKKLPISEQGMAEYRVVAVPVPDPREIDAE